MSFRPGATTGSLVVWSLVASIAAFHLQRRAHAWTGDPRTPLLLMIALLVLGPLALAAHLARMVLIKVTVLPDEGLLLSSGRRIAWSEMQELQYRGARFFPDFFLVRPLLDFIRSVSGLISTGYFGVVRLMFVLVAVLLSLLIPIAAFLSGVLFPVFFLLSPWQPRLLILLKTGERLVWRDLRHEADFAALVERGIRTSRPAEL